MIISEPPPPHTAPSSPNNLPTSSQKSPKSYLATLTSKQPHQNSPNTKISFNPQPNSHTPQNVTSIILKINIDAQNLKHIRAPWRLSVIVKCYGKTLGMMYFSHKIKQIWPAKGTFNIVDLGDDYFIVKFSLEEDFLKALHEGPWFANGFFLSVRLREPNFNPKTAVTQSAAIWLRIPCLPVEYYDANILKDVGNHHGTLLRIDTKTTNSGRGRFARLCIQLDLGKPVTTSVIIDTHL
ncbi:hypothetical protein LIER_23656 [Lithospermum erythrorhizon]|uniref:DUF4283 domain-containing protein n=1 Tax=Lithospermum erythrorhizon TaxID=34254 RepID=A0AAV3QZK1_LITER